MRASAVSLDCRGDDEFMYVTGGVIRDVVPVGPTSFYGEYYRGTREWNDSDPAKLAAFELNPTQALELDESEVTVWGFGVVQKFNDAAKPVSKKDKGAKEAAALGEPIMEVFVGYKHYELDVDLIGRNAALAPVDVAAKKLNDFDAVVSGAIIRF